MNKQVQSRRNLGNKQHREMWNEARKEDHPLHYQLHYPDKTTKNIKCDKLTLLAEIRETKPVKIERVLGKDHSHIMNFSERCVGLLQLIEVHDDKFLKNSSECSGCDGVETLQNSGK